MATLDASVLQEIGPSLALDPAGAKMKAYTLKNEMDASQMNTMKIADAKQEMARKQAIDKALSGNTLATEEDRQRAIQDVSKSAGGLAAMDLARTFSQQRQQALQERELETNIQKHLTSITKDQFETYTMKNDAFDSTLVPVMDRYKQLTDAGMPSDEAKAAVQVDYQTALMTLVNKTDATGTKIYGDPGSMQKLQQLGPTFDPSKLMPLIADSEKARKYLDEAAKARAAQEKDKAEIAHLGAETGLALERTKNLREFGGGGGTGEAEKAVITAMAENGALRPGQRTTPAIMTAIRGLIAKYPGETPDQLADRMKTGQIDIGAQKTTETKFDSGPQGNSVRSFNVALSHLDTLERLGDALNNNDTKALNTFANAWKSQTGQTAPVSFDAVKNIVADEIVKAVTGSAGALGDREAAANTINKANSPAQLKAVINNYKELMVGQLRGLKQQYTSSGLPEANFDKKLSPKAKELLGMTSGGDAKSILEQHGQTYQPDVYDYKVENGQVFSKRK